MKLMSKIGKMFETTSMMFLLFAVIVILALCWLCESIAGYAATLSLSGHKRRLLSQLRKVGKPYWWDNFWGAYDLSDEPYSPCPNHGESCTPDNCLIKQAEKYQELVRACEAVKIKPWRIRLVA